MDELARTRLLARLWRQLKPRRKLQFIFVVALILVGAIAEVLTLGAVVPFLAILANPDRTADVPLLGGVLAGLGLESPRQLLLILTVFFIAAAVCAGIARIVIAWATNKYVFAVGHDLGVGVYERVLYRPYSYHTSRNSSEILSATMKVQTVTSGVLLPLMQSFASLLIGSCIIIALFIVDPLISLVAFLGFGSLYVLISLLARRTLRANSRVLARTQTERIQAIQEGLGGIRDVLIDGTQPVFVRRFRTRDQEMRSAQATSTFIGAAPRYVMEMAGMMFIAGLAYFLAADGRNLASIIPVLGALAIGAQRLLPLMQQVYNGWTRIVASFVATGDVLEVLETPIPDALRTQPPPLPFRDRIAFRHVSFAYASERSAVLQNVNFTIEKGSRVGIVGKTGSGKSTTVDLLMGLLEPTQGAIEIDGVPLDEASRKAWQRQIAHVPQAIFLADASIAENIAFGVPLGKIDMARVRRAAQQAEIASFIENQPRAYETMVGERGARLSGGQRQRIGIARALYKEASVLIFDEATNALDDTTEAAVIASLRQLGRDITVIIIAHRLGTLAHCDQILSTEKGAVMSASHISEDGATILPIGA